MPITAVPSTPLNELMPPPSLSAEDNQKSPEAEGDPPPQPYSSDEEAAAAGGSAGPSAGSPQGGRPPAANASGGSPARAQPRDKDKDEDKQAREAAAAKRNLVPLSSEPSRAPPQQRAAAEGSPTSRPPSSQPAGRAADAPKGNQPSDQRRQAPPPVAGQAGAAAPVQTANAAKAEDPPNPATPRKRPVESEAPAPQAKAPPNARDPAKPAAGQAADPPPGAQLAERNPRRPGTAPNSEPPPPPASAQPNERSPGKPGSGQGADPPQSEAKAQPNERSPGKPGEGQGSNPPPPGDKEAPDKASAAMPAAAQGAEPPPPEDCPSDEKKEPVVLVMDGTTSMGLPVDMDLKLEAELNRRMESGDNAALLEYRRWLATDKPKRIDAVKGAFSEMLANADPKLAIAAVSFTSCTAIQTHPFVSFDSRSRLDSFVGVVTPHRNGYTALTKSIEAALKVLDTSGAKRGRVVLLTDGEQESCGGDLCALARATARDRPGVKIDVVDVAGHSNATCLTEATGGRLLNFAQAGNISLSGMLVQVANQCQTGTALAPTAGKMGQLRQ